MTVDITGLCRDHSFEAAEDMCHRCGGEYCELCLVYPAGGSKPLCKECAMAAGGVRSHVSRPALPRKELRRKLKAFEAHRLSRSASASALPEIEVTDPLAPTDDDLERVAAPVTVPEDGEAFADELATAFDETPLPPPPPGEEPADGVAPPIDWNRPFG